LMRALLKGRMYRLAAALAVIVPSSVLYLYEASAVSDQVWVTRRFLVGSFPALILLGVGLAAFGWGTRTSGWPRVAIRGLSVVVAVAAVAWPLHTIRPVRAMQEKHNFLEAVYGVCDDIGPNAVVILLRADMEDFTDQWLPQTLRSWCGAQVAAAHGANTAQDPAVDPDEVRELAQQYQTRGQKVFVVANSPETITTLLPEARPLPPHTVIDRKELVRTLTHRPNSYMTEKYSVTVAQVPAA